MFYTAFKDYNILMAVFTALQPSQRDKNQHIMTEQQSFPLIDQFDSLTETLLLGSMHLNCQ